MALNTLPVEHEYEPGVAQAPEALPFQFLTGDDLIVEVLRAAGGGRVPLLPGEDYLIGGDGPAGTGTITATANHAPGDKFLIQRRTAIKQVAVLPPHQPLPSRDVERQLDRMAMVAQEGEHHREVLQSRALMVPSGEDAPQVGSLVGADGMALGVVDGEIRAIPNDVAGSAQIKADVTAMKEDVAADRGAVADDRVAVAEDRAATALLRNEAQAARADTEELYDLTAVLASARPYASWADLDAVTGAPGDSAVVLADAGTHTDPVVGGTVANAGVYGWVASPAGWQRLADTEAAQARKWAEGTTPGGPGSYSAKEWSEAAETAAAASQAASQRFSPFAASANAGNATGGDDAAWGRLLAGVVDVKLYGLSGSDTYRIERVRRNTSGLWGARITRATDNAIVAEASAAVVEPTDPTQPQTIYLPPSAVAGAFGFIRVRWSAFQTATFTSGWTAALGPQCIDRFNASPENTLTASAVRPGQIIMPIIPGQFASRDEAARSFAWPQLMIVDGRSNASGRYRIAAGTVTFTNAWEVAFVDLDELASYGTAEAPNTVIKKAVYGRDLGSDGNFAARPNQLPFAWSPGAGQVDVNPLFRIPLVATGAIYADEIVIKVDPASNNVGIYVRANGGSASQTSYILYNLYHHVSAIADVWTIRSKFQVQRTGYEAFSAGIRLMVNDAEILCAIRENGAGDFMGGSAHGNEVVTQTPTLLLDGAEIPLTGGVAWYHGRTLTFVQSSRLYRVGSALGTVLAARRLFLTFEAGAMEAEQRIEHLASWTVADGYLAMLAPHRYVDFVGGTSENTGSAQISGKYADNVRAIPMDISTRQSSDAPEDTVRVSPPVRRVKMWGTHGVEMGVEVLDASHPILTDLFYINRRSYAYNKAYIGFVGTISGNQAVTAADKWRVKTRWSVRAKN